MAEQAYAFDDSAAYERCIGRWSRAMVPLFLQWLAAPAQAHWLDLGCGTGVLSERVLQQSSPASVHGVDVEAAQVATAAKGPAGERAQFIVADAQHLPFGDAAFDVTASALVINFIPDKATALAEMRRVTRAGGLVAGYVWDFAEEFSPSGPLRRGMRRCGVDVPAIPGTEASRIESLQALFRQAGLADIEARTIEVCLSYENFGDFWDAQTPGYAPTTKVIERMTPAERMRLRRVVESSLPAGPGGRIEYCARANAIKARVPG